MSMYSGSKGGNQKKLCEKGLTGERVILMTMDDFHFVIAFYACLMAGAVAVPSPSVSRKRFGQRLHLLVNDAQAKALIADSDDAFALPSVLSLQGFDCRSHLADKNNAALAKRWHPPELSPTSLAFLQYTSGFTGIQPAKGSDPQAFCLPMVWPKPRCLLQALMLMNLSLKCFPKWDKILVNVRLKGI
jgi:acyl-CoA synthetase (AMP-forming)/AMP-acid ligase II